MAHQHLRELQLVSGVKREVDIAKQALVRAGHLVGSIYDCTLDEDRQDMVRDSIHEMTNRHLFGGAMYDGVAMLDGWEIFSEARLHRHVAQACGIPCKPWREWLG